MYFLDKHLSLVTTKSNESTFSPFKVILPLLINSLASLLLEQVPELTNKSTIFKSSLILNGSNPLNASFISFSVKFFISPLNNDSEILTASS